MKIVLATALFPPDIGGSAWYVKELATRLSERHSVTVVTYGRLPESVPGVSIVAIDKRDPLPIRLMRFLRALRRALRGADVCVIENGPSVELPAGIATQLSGTRLIVHRGDKAAHLFAHTHPLRGMIERFASSRAAATVTTVPEERPEILPFHDHPKEEYESYERSWKSHLETLSALFHHV